MYYGPLEKDGHVSPEQDSENRRALASLVDQLVRDGWKHESTGAEWFNYRLRRAK